MEIKSMNIYQKIQAVSMEIMNVEKDMTVGKGSYKYQAVSDNQVTLAVKRAEQKYRLVSIPVSQELIKSETLRTKRDNGTETITHIDTIKMVLKIVNLDNIEQEQFIESFGKGIDSSDKGFGKASTYARKYALLNAYKIATGEDPDAEKSTAMTIEKKPSEKLVAITNHLEQDVNKHNQVLSHFNINNLSELKENQIKSLYDTFNKKGLL